MGETFSIGSFALVLLVAAGLALAVSAAVLAIYRRAVRRSMLARSGTTVENPVQPSMPWPAHVARPHLELRTIEPAASGNRVGSPVSGAARKAAVRSAGVYAAAGCAHAAAAVGLFFWASRTSFLPVRTLVVWWVYCWPVLLTLNLLWGPGFRRRAASSGVYFGIFALLSALLQEPSFRQLLVLWASLMLAPTLLLAAFLSRPIRAIGPLVFTFMTICVWGTNLALGVVATGFGMRSVAQVAVGSGVDVRIVALGIAITSFALFGIGGWMAVRWIGRRHEAKQTSDQAVTLDALWLLFTLVEGSNLTIERGVLGLCLGALPFVLYKAVQALGRRQIRREAPQNKKLLLLRVFGARRRSEKLFDLLGALWRYVGSVQMIAGTDLASTNIEPHEFLDFVRGRLTRHFIGTGEQLERRMAGMDLAPDPDGRFRVNEFFCFDNTWKLAVTRLALTADAILMDLRGFSRENQGCLFELRTLAESAALDKVLLLVDRTTSLALLEQTLAEALESAGPASPNGGEPVAVGRLLRMAGTSAAGVRNILRAFDGAGDWRGISGTR